MCWSKTVRFWSRETDLRWKIRPVDEDERSLNVGNGEKGDKNGVEKERQEGETGERDHD